MTLNLAKNTGGSGVLFRPLAYSWVIHAYLWRPSTHALSMDIQGPSMDISTAIHGSSRNPSMIPMDICSVRREALLEPARFANALTSNIVASLVFCLVFCFRSKESLPLHLIPLPTLHQPTPCLFSCLQKKRVLVSEPRKMKLVCLFGFVDS